jgi:hypothetical protein
MFSSNTPWAKSLFGIKIIVIAFWLCSAHTSLARAEDGKDDPLHFRRNIEWLEMNVGGGLGLYNVQYDYADDHGIQSKALACVDILLFNLHIEHLSITLLEVHPFYLFGNIGAGVRVGGRIPLSNDYRYELRMGSFLGGDSFSMITPFIDMGFSIRPYFQFVYNDTYGSVGLGMDGSIIIIKSISDGDSHTAKLNAPFAGCVLMYVRFSIGRTPL